MMMKGDSHPKEPEMETMTKVEVSAEKREDGGTDVEKKHERGGGGRRYNRGGRGRWKNDRGRNRNNWKCRGSNFSRDFRRQEKAEDLYLASLAQKKDRVVSFDCRIRPKSELSDWLRQNKPSTLKRSDGVGYIAVLSENITTPLEEKLATTGMSDPEDKHPELQEVWQSLVTDPTCLITYSTIRNLARKFKVCGGKWLFSIEGTGKVDDLWMYLCSSVMASNEDAKLGCLAVKITPVQDVEEEGVKPRDRNSHMVSVYTRDFCDEDDVFAVERRLRSIPIHFQMTYKPDLFTVLGIYRNNRFKLRPTIYSSEWHPKSHTSVIDSVFDMSWSYRGGAGDLREHVRDFDKVVQDVGRLYVTREKIIDDSDEQPAVVPGEKPEERNGMEDAEAKIEKKDDPKNVLEDDPETMATKEDLKNGLEEKQEEKLEEIEKDDANVEENSDEKDPFDFVEEAIKEVLQESKKTEAEGN